MENKLPRPLDVGDILVSGHNVIKVTRVTPTRAYALEWPSLSYAQGTLRRDGDNGFYKASFAGRLRGDYRFPNEGELSYIFEANEYIKRLNEALGIIYKYDLELLPVEKLEAIVSIIQAP